nr:hypothetical protein [Rhizobium sp. T1473]
MLPFGGPEPHFKNDTSIIRNCNTLTISYWLHHVVMRKNEVKTLDRNDFPVHVEEPVILAWQGFHLLIRRFGAFFRES